MSVARLPPIDASSAERHVLRQHLQRLLDCDERDADGIMAQCGVNGRVESPTRESKMKYNFDLRRSVQEYRSRSQSPQPHPVLPGAKEDDEDNAMEGERFMPRCPKCFTTQLEHAAIQTRSADEAPTNFYKCKNAKCECFNKIVKPVYRYQ